MDIVLNWVVQGSAVAAITTLCLRLLQPARPRARYAVACSGLLLVLLLPLIPLLPAAFATAASPTPAGGPKVAAVLTVPHHQWSVYVALSLWTIWMAVCTARGITSALALRRAKARCRPVPHQLEARLRQWLRLKTRGRAARLAFAEHLGPAAVLGFGDPVIALAPDLVSRLSDAELDQVVIHEWAHVQRRDDIAGALDLVIGIIAGWHPGVWWLNRERHREREAACDELVVEATGAARAYAACLVKLASLPHVRLSAPPAPGLLASTSVRRRVIDVLALERAASPAWSWAVVAGVFPLLGTVAAAAGAVPIFAVHALVPGGPAPIAAALMPAQPTQGREHAAAFARLPQVEGTSPAVARQPRAASTTRGPVPAAEPGAQPPAPEADRPSPTPTDAPPDANLAPPQPAVAEAEPLPTLLGSRALGQNLPSSSDPSRARAVMPWDVAADAGKAVGRGSEDAAIATAGFFTRFAKSVASSF